MDLKKIGKALLFPHIAIMILLIPVSTAFLVCSMVFLGTESPIAIISYVLSAYTLTVWCFKIPHLIKFFKSFKEENKYVKRWLTDERLRVNVSLYGSLVWNAAYGLFHIWLGILHHSFWFFSLATYYIFLAVMRFFMFRYTKDHKPGENMRDELKRYRACGIVLLIMNLALSLMVFFMVYWNRTFTHHEITTITIAAYTFIAFTVAIINTVRYRKYNSPVYSASKAISLASACVSMLTLSSTMLTTFGDGSITLAQRKLMLGLIGGTVVAFIVAMAVYMIAQGAKKLKQINTEEQTNGN